MSYMEKTINNFDDMINLFEKSNKLKTYEVYLFSNLIDYLIVKWIDNYYFYRIDKNGFEDDNKIICLWNDNTFYLRTLYCIKFDTKTNKCIISDEKCPSFNREVIIYNPNEKIIDILKKHFKKSLFI